MIADAFGRPCLSGTCRAIELSSASSAVRACRDEAGELAGYRVTGATLTDARILTANYYDDYSFIGNYGVPASVAFTSAGDTDTRCPDVRGKLTGTMTAVGAEADSLLTPSAGYLCTALYYDIRDRVIQNVSTNHLGGVDRTVTTYDFAGHPLLTQTTHTTAADPQGIVQQLERTYDSQGRPLDVSHRTGREGGWTSLSLTSYDRLGRPASERRGSLESAVTEYSYDLRSRLVSMTSTLYSQSLAYTAAGNIASLTWTAHGAPQRTYRYGYDSLSRLTRARYSDSEGGAGHYDTRYSYDLNGNLTSLVRRGALSLSSAGTPSAYGAIDSLTLEYAGNRLRSVSDAAAGPHYQGAFHFADGADEDEEYRYDFNGNTVTDLNRGILSSRFDMAGHPARMDFADGSSTSYLYDDAGTKLRTLHRVASVPVAVPGSQGPALTETVTDYCAGFVYEDSLLTRINLDGAYLSYAGADGSRLSTPEYHFYLRDHLGNNRVDVAADGRICQMTDYYPYGLPMASSRNAAAQRWLFGGKELDRISGLDLYDFEARAYDPALARFTSHDAFEEKYPSLTPYLYCAANPLRLIDPTGNKTYLFATRLPGPLGYSIIPTHTFIYVDKSNKDNNSSQKKFQEKNYIAFGPDHPLAGGRLRRVYYEEDEESIKNMLNGDKDNRTKAVIEVPTPEGMSKEEFDNKVLEAGNSFGNNKEIEYKLNPTGECEGNCNTSSSTLLINAGVDEKGIKAIKAEIPGLDRGFSHIPKPWTKQEQSDAAKRKYKP